MGACTDTRCLPSPHTQVRDFVRGAYERTVALLREKQHLVEDMAQVGAAAFLDH